MICHGGTIVTVSVDLGDDRLHAGRNTFLIVSVFIGARDGALTVDSSSKAPSH